MVILCRVLINIVVVAVVCSLFALNAAAEVSTRVDRNSVDLNESFVLEITVDTNVDSELDLSALDENFYRGQVSKLQNTTIINGQIRRSLTWTIPMMAKATGKQEIPAITIGNESSEPLSITINEPRDAPPGEADVFVTSEIDQTEAYVQSQILYRFKVYRAVATRQEGRRLPGFSGAEVLIEQVGDDRSYEAILNGRAYSVLERVMAIYPQSSGEVTITPATYEARVLRDGRITGRKVFETDQHVVTVLPIPAPPAEFPDAAWLPARDVELSDEWSREPDRLTAGEPLTRKVTVSALGQIETQLPTLQPPDVEGMNIYPDKPDLSRQIEAEGIRGIRRDQYAMIGVRGGAVELPELNVPWWDLAAGEWKVASLPPRTIEIEALEEDVVAAAADVADTPRSEDAPQTGSADSGFWKKVSQMIAAIWLLTVIAWWWSSREKTSEPRVPAPPPIYKQQAKFVKAAKKAAVDGDRAAVRAAMLEWALLQWPANPPRSVGEIATRVAAPLSDELNALSASSYSNAAGEFDRAAFARALRSIKELQEPDAPLVDDFLPPLMPPGT